MGAVIAGLTALLLSSCGKPADPFTPGADVNTDQNSVFAKLMKLPDIDQAAAQYQRMADELQTALGDQIPALKHWTLTNEQIRAACGNDYPGIGSAGEDLSLENRVVPVKLSDADYERALGIVGAVATKYGFTSQPQRMHDAPGSHDAFFHNQADASSIQFGTDKQTLIGITVGCHLTASTKKLGHLPPKPSY
ncbi:LppA family lipoprotein [Amycolatopsis sp. NPDC003676]